MFNLGGCALLKNKKKIAIAIYILVILLLLVACSQREIDNNKPMEKGTQIDDDSIIMVFEHPDTKEKFKIVKAYKLFNNFISKAEDISDKSSLELYKKDVIEPIYNDCFANGEHLHMANSILHTAPDNLNDIKRLTEKIESKETTKIIKEALLKSSEILPYEKETTVCVFPFTNQNFGSMVTVGSGKITVLYNKYYTDEVLRAGIAHEYHHSYWTENHLTKNMSFSVLDNLIFEGKAVTFEKLVYPDIDFTPIYSSFNTGYWSQIEPDLIKHNLQRSLEILLGGNGLPRNYGYSEGYKMVQSYLDLNPDITPKEWTGLSAKEIYEEGNYLKNYR
ncbi:Zn-dependent protease [Bacillus sp. S/N-304-OC-R1]|nr:Zn-dependent protease [Bacillus sp. S/N-304-OC-R1]